MNKALFWDFDGTLSYPNKSFFTALHTALYENGYAVEYDETVEFLKATYSWRSPQKAYPEKCGELWWDTFFEKICDFCGERSISSDAQTKICVRFRELLIDVNNYKLYDDTIETLKKCTEQGYKNFIITNNYPEIVDNIKRLGIAKYFTDYIVSSNIGYEKPRTEFFDYAKKVAGNPDVGYVIGDNPIADIEGGKVAGIKTIAVRECKNSTADYYSENLAQIFLFLT